MKNGWFGRISSFILCLVMVLSVVGSARADDGVLGKDNAGSITFTLYAGEYAITQDKEDLDVVQMEGFSSTTSPGDPMLPHKVYNIAVPPDIVWSSLKLNIVSAGTSVLDGTYDIRPAPPILPGTNDTEVEESVQKKESINDRNMEVYGTDAEFPESYLELLPYSQMRKWKYTRVDFTPFQYNPVSQKLTLIQSLTIEITYDQSGIEPQASLMNDTVMDDVAAQIFSNYQQVKSRYKPRAITESSSVTYDYVIITTNAIEANSTKLSSFASHKASQGHSALVITEDEFDGLAGQSPNHKAEKIRKWLIDNYVAMGIQYVLLIGDPHPYESTEGDIPMKMCHPEMNQTEYPDCEPTPTDYFYADLTGNWDHDGDGYYGEWTDDYPVPGGVDFAPEVYVGRIPVYGAAYSTLDSVLQKIIDYETEASIGWRKSALLPMGFQKEGYDGAPLAEQMRDDYLNAAGFSSWRMYQQGNGACGVNSIYTSEEELRGGTVVRDRWAASDYGIVCWWGHGSETRTIVGYDPGCDDGILFQSSYCSSLDDDHPSFTYQCSCTNGYPEHSDNLQYAILKQGGIGTVSASRVSWFNTGVGYGEFDGSPTNSGIGYEYASRLVSGNPAGQALYSTKQSMTPDDHQCWLMNWYDFNLYGDPATSLSSQGGEPNITVTPTDFDVTLPPNTTQDYTLTIGNDGDADLAYNISDRTTGGVGLGGAENLLLEPASELLVIPLAGDVVEPEEIGASGWQNIMTEDFEGAFPTGSWAAFDNDGATNGSYYWDEDDYKPHWGSWSAWCANGGANGLDPEFYYYPNDMKSWMVYGPFSLSNAIDAELNFWYWLEIEKDWDKFGWLASIDGSLFYGYSRDINTVGWENQSFNLTSVPTLGNLCGESQVWVAFIFQSDFMIGYQGAFIDDVALRKTSATEDCPWLSENPTSGSVTPGGSANITVSINTTGLGSNYTAEIIIASNDPDENPTIVPVTLHVSAQAPTVTTSAATNVEETTATLNGMVSDDGGEACQYRFEYDTDPGEPYAYNTSWTGSKTTGQSFSESVLSLAKGTKYYFRAQAKNSAGTGIGSELTFLTKPDAPTGFNATTANSTRINLSWAKGDGAQQTKIQRKEGSYPSNRDDGTQVYFDTGTSTSDSGLTSNTTYYYRAWSQVSGSEQWSDSYAQDSATTASGITPPTVTTNAATNVEETTATLNGAVSDDGGEACQYRFEYDTDSGEPYAYSTGWTGSKTTGQSFSESVSSLAKGTKYYFRAQAKNSAGTGSGSELTFLTKPDEPSSFNASTAGSTQINLSWTKGDGAQKTKIQRKEGSYPTDRNDGTQVYNGTATSTPDTGLTPSTTYYYRAWSYVEGSEQWSDECAEDWATTGSAPNNPPNVPSNPSPANHATSVSINADLSSTGGDPDAGDTVTYDVYFGNNPTPPFTETIGPYAANQTAISYDVETLACNTTYYWKIVATDSHGIVKEGPLWDFSTAPSEPTQVLYAGANPIAYHGKTMSLPEALTNISDYLEIIWQRDVSTGGEWHVFYFYQGYPMGQIAQLVEGKAYVVVVTQYCTWKLHC